jgi:hypothetical protein
VDRAMWIARKNTLCGIIKRVSDAYGGDNIEWLREHCRQVIEAHPGDLIEAAITCYQEMIEQIRYLDKQ